MTTPLELFGQPRTWLTDVYRKRYVAWVIVCEPTEFRPDFLSWVSENWHIWVGFEAEAMRTKRRGFKHYSARTIWHVLRHETALREGPDAEWKINNNYSPDAARLFMKLHPDMADFFETRERIAEAFEAARP